MSVDRPGCFFRNQWGTSSVETADRTAATRSKTVKRIPTRATARAPEPAIV